jgi:hypothetical protein
MSKTSTSSRRKGVTWQTLLGFAAELPSTEQGICYGTPALYVKKRLLARLREDGETVAIKIDMFDRDVLLQADPETFYLTDHYRPWPMVLMRLAKVRPTMARQMLEQAWMREAPKTLAAERAAGASSKTRPSSARRRG